MKIEFAAQNKINKHPEIRDKFMDLVLGHPEALITDESIIYHFEFEEDDPADTEFLVGKTQEVFGVDISSLLNEPICDIIEYVHQTKQGFN